MQITPAASDLMRCRTTRIAALLATIGTAAMYAAAAEPGGKLPEGFVSLLDPGNELTGWQGVVGNPVICRRQPRLRLRRLQRLADADMLVHWHLRDGVLEHDGQGKNIATVRQFCNFELYLEWKIPPGGESGIYLRGVPQVQIWDPARENVGAEVGSGGLPHNRRAASRPLQRADHPAGAWNTFQITMVDERVTVRLNGHLVVDDQVMENYWEPDRPIYPCGPIELQASGSKVWFRNIYLRELPAAAPER